MGPRTDPCGTPHPIHAGDDAEGPLRTYWRRPTRYDLSHCSTVHGTGCHQRSATISRWNLSRLICSTVLTSTIISIILGWHWYACSRKSRPCNGLAETCYGAFEMMSDLVLLICILGTGIWVSVSFLKIYRLFGRLGSGPTSSIGWG